MVVQHPDHGFTWIHLDLRGLLSTCKRFVSYRQAEEMRRRQVEAAELKVAVF